MMPVNSLLESVVLSQVDCLFQLSLDTCWIEVWQLVFWRSTFVEVLTHTFISFMGPICQSIIYWTLGSIVTLNWFAHWWLADCLLIYNTDGSFDVGPNQSHDTWLMNDIPLIHRIFTTLQFTHCFLEDGERLLTLHGHGGSEEAAARGLHPWYVHMLWGKWCWCGVDWQIHSWQTLLEWISDLAGQKEERITFPHFTEHLDINYASLLVTCHV